MSKNAKKWTKYITQTKKYGKITKNTQNLLT